MELYDHKCLICTNFSLHVRPADVNANVIPHLTQCCFMQNTQVTLGLRGQLLGRLLGFDFESFLLTSQNVDVSMRNLPEMIGQDLRFPLSIKFI